MQQIQAECKQPGDRPHAQIDPGLWEMSLAGNAVWCLWQAPVRITMWGPGILEQSHAIWSREFYAFWKIT